MVEIISKPQLVAIGCSAGGIEALSIFVATLKAPFPAPIVIAQHLDPRRPSHLAEVLARKSALPIRAISERTALEPGVIYVVPSNRHVTVTDHDIEPIEDGGEQHKPSVDILFRSAADAYGENLIAVILTGSGSDGAAGARHVKKCGGTVVIQNPETASFPSMPESVSPTIVDIVADLDRIGPLLTDLLSGVYVDPIPEEERRLLALLDLVRERSGIDFKKYKQATILRRLRRRLVATDTEDVEGYVRYLDAHPEEYQRLINSFLIKVTEFMRDPDLFAYLRDSVLPDLVAHARLENRSLRIWSAGCATGEEAYSLAILVCEILGDEIEGFTIRIFSTDVDSEAIAFARRGIYAPSAVEDLPRDLVDKYFVPVEGNYQVKKRVRNLTVFGEHDLGQRAPFPHIDLVVCRNVLIYFTTELQRRTLQLFAFSLREGGYLVLGKAETTSPLGDFYVAQDAHHKVYVRRGERVLIPPTRGGGGPPPQSPRRGVRRGKVSPPPVRIEREAPRMRMPIDLLLASLPYGVILVDAHYDILEINFAARRLLGIHGPAVGQDFVHLAQSVPHRPLLEAIDRAFRGEVPEPLEVTLDSVPPGEVRTVEITCFPTHGDDAQKLGGALVLVREVTAEVGRRAALDAARAQATAIREELAQVTAQGEAERARLSAEVDVLRRKGDELASSVERADVAREQGQGDVERLTEANRRLLRANEELTGAHEHLRSANEELMLSSEEAQAATEEVETLNEEFQATNEELETVNEELQSTIEELNTTNADLESRSREMLDLAAPNEAERARFTSIFRSMADGLVIVDAQGRTVLANEAYQEMLGGTRAVYTDERGRPFPFEETPEQRAARGERFQMEFSVPGASGGARQFEAIGRPLVALTATGIEGGVIAVRDITERGIRKLQQRFMAIAGHELRAPIAPLRSHLDELLAATTTPGAEGRVRGLAELARSDAEKLDRIVGDIVSASRLQTGRLQVEFAPLEMGSLLDRTAERARSATSGPPIVVERSTPEPLWISGDALRIEQAIGNLLENAIEHAPKSPKIDLRLRRSGEAIEIEVQDYGPGIPAVDLPHVFASFYQVDAPDASRPDGMGLGLYISKEIVRAHGGQLTARSVEGKGTTFCMRLPRVGPPSQL